MLSCYFSTWYLLYHVSSSQHHEDAQMDCDKGSDQLYAPPLLPPELNLLTVQLPPSLLQVNAGRTHYNVDSVCFCCNVCLYHTSYAATFRQWCPIEIPGPHPRRQAGRFRARSARAARTRQPFRARGKRHNVSRRTLSCRCLQQYILLLYSYFLGCLR